MSYQSYVDHENGARYRDMLCAHRGQIVDPGAEIKIHGIVNAPPHVINEFLTHPKGL